MRTKSTKTWMKPRTDQLYRDILATSANHSPCPHRALSSHAAQQRGQRNIDHPPRATMVSIQTTWLASVSQKCSSMPTSSTTIVKTSLNECPLHQTSRVVHTVRGRRHVVRYSTSLEHLHPSSKVVQQNLLLLARSSVPKLHHNILGA